MSIEIAQPFTLDQNGIIATVTTPGDIVQQHVNALISVETGQRVMLPTYGLNLANLMFQPNDPVLLNMLQNDVSEAFTTWEPSVQLTSVEQSPATDAQYGVAAVSVAYAVGTNISGTAVAPVYQTATISQGGTVTNQ